jgi:hypothetical protein
LTANNQPLPPEGVVFVGANPYVLDTGNARILSYPPYDQWPVESTAFSPSAISVIGQQSFAANTSNQGFAQPNASTLAGPIPNSSVGGPVAAAFAGNVVDSGNHHVLSFPQQSAGSFISAERVLGQLDFPYNSQNLIEGREVGFEPNANSRR